MSGALKAKAAAFPAQPGIYFFKDAGGGVVYIGKARNLRERVKSYFQPTDDPKVRHILSETADLDYVLTASEREAAFLENNFVQQHQPKFNLRLKDDKSFPFLKLTLADAFPGLYFCRRVGRDGSRYFGPFSPAGEARQAIRLVSKFFGLRTCEPAVFRGRSRPCLEYDLKQCSAPCVGLIGRAAYLRRVADARLLLEGRTDRLAEILRRRMERAAQAEAFEEAGHWRDVLKALDQVRIQPAIISVRQEDQDVFGAAEGGGRQAVYAFIVRGGKVVRSHERVLDPEPGRSSAEARIGAIRAFYESHQVPPKVLVDLPAALRKELAAALAGKAGARVAILSPAGGKNRALLEMAVKNAERILADRDASLQPLLDLKAALGLPSAPARIEGFDVSNTGGTETVASSVLFENGRPAKDGYRKYKIRGVEGPNDVASLAEALTRRLSRALAEGAPLPDLVLVDGGKPQLQAARRVLRELGLDRLPLASLAKREEIVFVPGRPAGIRLARTAPALKLLQHVRDEAHRFAVRFHRQRRTRKSFA